MLLLGCSKAPVTNTPEVVEPAAAQPAVADVEPEPEPELRCLHLEVCLAMVGDVEIPYTAFSAIYDLKVAKYTARGREIPDSAARRYRKSIAERLIYHEVLAQEAAAAGVEFDAAALEKREAQQRRGIRDWDKHLERRGETEASLRAMYVSELREVALLEARGALALTPEEVAADYALIRINWRSDKPRVRASHILVPLHANLGPDSTPAQRRAAEAEAKKKAWALHAEVTKPGADFAEVARRESTGPSADKGGDIGIFTADRMAEEFSKAAFRLKPGTVSTPVRTKFGYHLIVVTGKWPPGDLPLQALEPQIRERLRQRKLHHGRRTLKEELLQKYEILDHMTPTLGPEPQRPKRRPLHERVAPPPRTVMR